MRTVRSNEGVHAAHARKRSAWRSDLVENVVEEDYVKRTHIRREAAWVHEAEVDARGSL
jgi:hypothetical protein